MQKMFGFFLSVINWRGTKIFPPTILDFDSSHIMNMAKSQFKAIKPNRDFRQRTTLPVPSLVINARFPLFCAVVLNYQVEPWQDRYPYHKV